MKHATLMDLPAAFIVASIIYNPLLWFYGLVMPADWTVSPDIVGAITGVVSGVCAWEVIDWWKRRRK